MSVILIFDIKYIAIKFATYHISIYKEDLLIIEHARKYLPYNQETPWKTSI